MKKFQEWQSNQTYLHHLDRLSNIKLRKYSPDNSKTIKRMQSNPNLLQLQIIQAQNNRLIQSIQNPRRQVEFKIQPTKKKQKSKLKKCLEEQYLAYQNYLFGKRILQTTAVISKKALDKQYKIHKRALKTMCKARCQSNSTQQISLKLNQYIKTTASNFYAGEGSNILTFKITDFQIYKHKLGDGDFSDLSIELHLNNTKICSQFVKVNSFVGHQFTFRFKKKHLVDNKMEIHLKHNKGNSDIQLCYFEVNIQEYLADATKIFAKTQKLELFKRVGSVAGSIQMQIQIYKRKS